MNRCNDSKTQFKIMNENLFNKIHQGYEVLHKVALWMVGALAFIQIGPLYTADFVYQYAFLNKRWQASLLVQCTQVKGCTALGFDESYYKPSPDSPRLQLLGTHLIVSVTARQGMQAQVMDELSRRLKESRSRQVYLRLQSFPVGG